MSHHDRLETELRTLLDRFNATPPVARLYGAEIRVEHYASHLHQNYFQLRERPVILSLAASRLTGSGEAARLLHKRAIAEIFHDRLALNDLEALGVDVKGIPEELPYPETTALLAFGHYQVERLAPVGVLGMMYFLDFAPLYANDEIADSLERVGVPAGAMSSLEDSKTVGVAHATAMRTFVDELVVGDAELEAVLYGMRTTATLFAQMVGAAFDAVDQAS